MSVSEIYWMGLSVQLGFVSMMVSVFTSMGGSYVCRSQPR